MIVAGAIKQAPATPAPQKLDAVPDQGGSYYSGGSTTRAKQYVSPETAKRVATVYRCSNGISDDIATMPIHQIRRMNDKTERVQPDPITRNMAYLLQIAPNRWMTPLIFVKTCVTWLQFWGNALIWSPPPPAPRELFILPTSSTTPKLDANGNLWYLVVFPNGEKKLLPAVEVLHVMLNSTNGIWGKSILEYARETIGLRMGMSETQSAIQADGLNASAYVQVKGNVDKYGRDKLRDAYSEAISGSDGAGRLAVFDEKIVKFEPITMKLTDAQFLESENATDRDIANFFKYPEYKLNMGKQSYESNAQHDIDYLKSTINPYLVQFEQAGRLRWVPEAEQPYSFFKFGRESILQTDAKTRAEVSEIRIRSGTLTPNQALGYEDMDSYPDGDKHWMTSNNAEIGAPKDGATPVSVSVETPKRSK